jgi:hypothetical protein
MTKNQTRKYKDYEIIPYSEGFQISPGTLIAIASFFVRKDDQITVFAFAVSFLDKVADLNLTDDRLLKQANSIIEKHIDDGVVKHLEEYTYGFYPSNFLQENNPKWWIKTLKDYYSEK